MHVLLDAIVKFFKASGACNLRTCISDRSTSASAPLASSNWTFSCISVCLRVRTFQSDLGPVRASPLVYKDTLKRASFKLKLVLFIQ